MKKAQFKLQTKHFDRYLIKSPHPEYIIHHKKKKHAHINIAIRTGRREEKGPPPGLKNVRKQQTNQKETIPATMPKY